MCVKRNQQAMVLCPRASHTPAVKGQGEGVGFGSQGGSSVERALDREVPSLMLSWPGWNLGGRYPVNSLSPSAFFLVTTIG